MDFPTNPLLAAPATKRRKLSLFDIFRGRNGGSSTSFLATSNTNIMDMTYDSETDEEDDEDEAQEYLNKMTDDTDRKIETVFGKGVEVWKSFGGTVYADVNDQIRKKQRDEALWGKKRKRGRGAADEQAKILAKRFDSLPNSTASSDSAPSPASDSAPAPGLTLSTYTDSTISYPSLPSEYDTSLPTTPTASEWEIFPVSQSQEEDFSAAPLEYRSLRNKSFEPGSAGLELPGSFDRPIKPLPARAHRVEGMRKTDTAGLRSIPPHRDRPNVIPAPPASASNTGFLGSLLGGARRMISGSFGSFDGREVDRFDERRYRLLPGTLGEAAEENQDGGGGGEEDGKRDKFKGRPSLRRR
jgi:hypothetical protein